MECIENLGIMMNRIILKFFKESNRTESLSEFSIDILSIFFREKQWIRDVIRAVIRDESISS